jgi:hypothetical protein
VHDSSSCARISANATTVHREDHHRRPTVLEPRVGVFSCGKAGGGRIRADPAQGVELDVTRDERGPEVPTEGRWKGK